MPVSLCKTFRLKRFQQMPGEIGGRGVARNHDNAGPVVAERMAVGLLRLVVFRHGEQTDVDIEVPVEDHLTDYSDMEQSVSGPKVCPEHIRPRIRVFAAVLFSPQKAVGRQQTENIVCHGIEFLSNIQSGIWGCISSESSC